MPFRLFAMGLALALLPAAGGSVRAATIADFVADFAFPTPKTGWSYEWTASGPIGNQANYASLLPDPNAFGPNSSKVYDVTPGTFPSAAPASYTILAQGFVHPGQGSGQTSFEHFTIAGYTLASGGTASIKNLLATDGDPSGGDGVDVFVGVNSGGSIVGGFANGGSYSAANTPLGVLKAGDTIYVAIGSKNNDGNDSTNLGYQIDLVPAAVPEPASLTLLGLGIAGLVGRATWHRRNSKRS